MTDKQKDGGAVRSKKRLTFSVPMTPNFIKIFETNQMVPIAEVDDASIKRIGVEWTRALLRKAKNRRSPGAAK